MSGEDVPQADQVAVDLDPTSVLQAYVHHRRRFATSVADLDAAALAHASRCSEWSVADVLRHGADVDEWMLALWSGNPPPFTTFDPNTTPHQFVVAGRALSDPDARDRYTASAERMTADVESSDQDRWGKPSFSPLGRVPWWLSTLHIFFDSWLHERDIFIPLGVQPIVEPDEIQAVLAYTLALVGVFAGGVPIDTVVGGVRLVVGEGRPSVRVVSPDETLNAAQVVDVLSGRGSIAAALPEAAPETVHALSGLHRFLVSA